jgi:tetratricopeptide (TPR) repeat protein
LKHQLSFGFNSSSKLIELVDMHTRQGKKYYASGDYEKSLELFSKALNEAPMDW